MVEETKIRGSVIKSPRDWLRTAYGTDAYRGALGQLPAEQQVMIDGDIYAAGWYPIASWDRFLDRMRAEALQRAGESIAVFNRRFMSETGSDIVRGVYRLVLGLMSPTTVIARVITIYNRAYSAGHCEILENVPGKGTIRHAGGWPDLRTNLSNHFAPGIEFALGLQGSQEIEARVVRDEVVDGRLLYDVAVTYRPS